MTPIKSTTPSEFDLLQTLGHAKPTAIQENAIPVLARGESLFALAPTGSGKTLAFLLPLMKRLQSGLFRTQLLVVAPTRELGAQIAQVAELVSKSLKPPLGRPLLVRTALGGQKADTQKDEILRRPAVVVATPGRALEFLEREILDISSLRAFVLDEADLMIGMGFERQVRRICDFLPPKVQVALFSATEAGLQTSLQNRLAHRATRIDVRERSEEAARTSEAGAAKLHQLVQVSEDQDRSAQLIRLIGHIAPQVATGIVFCQTRESTQAVARALRENGISAEALSGELGQIERATILRRFKAGGLQYLVATNLAARGIDVKELSVVINCDCPSTFEEYVHRAGRSGRAGNPGWTITLCTEKSHAFIKEILSKNGIEATELSALSSAETFRLEQAQPQMPAREFERIHLNRGKSSKIRPGDILGALVKDLGIASSDVGSIFIFDHFTHVEVSRHLAQDVIARTKRIKTLTVRATIAEPGAGRRPAPSRWS